MRCCGSWKLLVMLVVAAGGLSAVIGVAYTEPVEPSAAPKPETAPPEAVEAERSARERLRMTVTVRYEQRPLREAIEDLAKQAGVTFWIDETAFEAEAIPLDDPVDADLPDVTIETALEIILPMAGATWFVQDEILRVTTPAGLDDVFVTRAYDVRRLIAAIEPPFETDAIEWRPPLPVHLLRGITGVDGRCGRPATHPIYAIIDAVQGETSESWVELDGIGGSITPYGSLLFVRHNPRIQEEVAALLDGLTRMATAEKPAKPWRIADLAKEDEKVRAALERPVDVDWQAKPLEEAIAEFFQDSGIRHRLDRAALREEVIALDTPITLELRGVPRRTALEVAFEPLGLTWVVEYGFLIVTTDVVGCAKLTTIVYDVRDLLIDADFAPLIDLIENETSGPWLKPDGVGGHAIAFGPRLLIVRQTQGVQEETAEMFDLLREKRAVTAADQSDPDAIVTQFHRPPPSADPAETAAAVREFVAPDSWEGDDGGRIRAVGDVLVVRQTRRVQRRIERFFAELAAASERHRAAAIQRPQQVPPQQAAPLPPLHW